MTESLDLPALADRLVAAQGPARRIVAVAGGSEKVAAIAAVLTSRHLTGLVTDECTAKALLGDAGHLHHRRR